MLLGSWNNRKGWSLARKVSDRETTSTIGSRQSTDVDCLFKKSSLSFPGHRHCGRTSSRHIHAISGICYGMSPSSPQWWLRYRAGHTALKPHESIDGQN